MVFREIHPPSRFPFVALDIRTNKFIVEDLHSLYTLAPRSSHDAFSFDWA